MAEQRFRHQIKRIIDGSTYNTDTATELFVDITEDIYDNRVENALFKTRAGAYFIASYLERNLEMPLSVIPQDPEEAKAWLVRHCPTRPEILEREFGKQPEAGETEARFTLRMPLTLRARIEVLAKGSNQSSNAWVVKCLETCGNAQERGEGK